MEKILVKENMNNVLAMCKTHIENKEDDKLMFTDLTRDLFKNNHYILNKYFRNEQGYTCYYANLLAFKNIPNINLYEIKKQLRKDFGKSVSLAGFKYNPEHYKFATQIIQDEYEEDLFREKSQEDEDSEAEADRRGNIVPLDFTALESLSTVFFKALKKRYIMLFNLESIPAILNNAIECYYLGVSCGPSNLAMLAKIKEIRAMLEDPEMIQWLKTNPTDLIFDKSDYVNTYQKVLRQLTGIKNEPLSYCYELIHNEEDLFENEILSNEYIEFESYNSNTDSDEDE